MTSELRIDEGEVREIIVEWLDREHNIKIELDDLEDAKSPGGHWDGFKVDLQPVLNGLKAVGA